MHTSPRERDGARSAAARLGVIFMALFTAAPALSESSAQESSFTVLVFSKTVGYRHESIPAGIAAIKSLGDSIVHRGVVRLTAYCSHAIVRIGEKGQLLF